MFDARVESDRKRLREALTTPVSEVSPVVTPNTEELSPVLEWVADGREAEEGLNVAPDIRGRENGLSVDSRHCRNKGDEQVVARQSKDVSCDEPVVINASMDVDVDVVFPTHHTTES